MTLTLSAGYGGVCGGTGGSFTRCQGRRLCCSICARGEWYVCGWRGLGRGGEGWRGQLACGTTTNVEKGGVPEADINSLYSGADGCSGEPVTGLLWLLSHPF